MRLYELPHNKTVSPSTTNGPKSKTTCSRHLQNLMTFGRFCSFCWPLIFIAVCFTSSWPGGMSLPSFCYREWLIVSSKLMTMLRIIVQLTRCLEYILLMITGQCTVLCIFFYKALHSFPRLRAISRCNTYVVSFYSPSYSLFKYSYSPIVYLLHNNINKQ